DDVGAAVVFTTIAIVVSAVADFGAAFRRLPRRGAVFFGSVYAAFVVWHAHFVGAAVATIVYGIPAQLGAGLACAAHARLDPCRTIRSHGLLQQAASLAM